MAKSHTVPAAARSGENGSSAANGGVEPRVNGGGRSGGSRRGRGRGGAAANGGTANGDAAPVAPNGATANGNSPAAENITA